MANTYLGRCGDNWAGEDAEIDFPRPGKADTTLHFYECSSHRGTEDCSKCRKDANRVVRHRFSDAKYVILPSIVFIGKLLRGL